MGISHLRALACARRAGSNPNRLLVSTNDFMSGACTILEQASMSVKVLIRQHIGQQGKYPVPYRVQK